MLWRVEQGLTLRLWRDSSHVSPRLLALRYRDAPGGEDARDLVPLRDGDAENEADGADDVRNCFYSGDVVGEPGSKAVVSLCHGMTGYIYSPSRGMFTIEPVNGGEDQDQRGAHVLRHHRGGQSQASNSTQDDNSSAEDGEPSNSWSSDHQQQEQQGSASHRRRRRRKRSYSIEQHVEVLVAADSKMARYHGKNLKHYILTLMAAVAHIYKDPSIGNLLNIAVVKLLIMEEDEDNDIISPSASNTLKNFCRWQQQHNHPEDSHPYHHDTAILLTRLMQTAQDMRHAWAGSVWHDLRPAWELRRCRGQRSQRSLHHRPRTGTRPEHSSRRRPEVCQVPAGQSAAARHGPHAGLQQPPVVLVSLQ